MRSARWLTRWLARLGFGRWCPRCGTRLRRRWDGAFRVLWCPRDGLRWFVQ